jgi:uncharacterized protein (DUF433 family)
MNEILQTKPLLGAGIYTVSDIALILGIPYPKAFRLLNSFCGDLVAKKYGFAYSWNVGKSKAVNFHTLIELFTFNQLSKAGVSALELIKTHSILSEQYEMHYPFASKMVLEEVRIEGRKILFYLKSGSIYSVVSTLQIEVSIINEFLKNLDFDFNSLAVRFWPAGKDKAIVCDPQHQFGRPVISGTNINSEVLYRMYLAEEPIEFIAYLYGLTSEQVQDAIDYHKAIL